MKIAVVPPMPMASVSTAVTVKTRALQNCRSAWRTSPMKCPTLYPEAVLRPPRCWTVGTGQELLHQVPSSMWMSLFHWS